MGNHGGGHLDHEADPPDHGAGRGDGDRVYHRRQPPGDGGEPVQGAGEGADGIDQVLSTIRPITIIVR